MYLLLTYYDFDPTSLHPHFFCIWNKKSKEHLKQKIYAQNFQKRKRMQTHIISESTVVIYFDSSELNETEKQKLLELLLMETNKVSKTNQDDPYCEWEYKVKMTMQLYDIIKGDGSVLGTILTWIQRGK
jgi:hypothetical protein